MNTILRSLMALGALLREQNQGTSPTIKRCYYCEVTDTALNLKVVENAPVTLPRRVSKGTSVSVCNDFDENLQYLLGIKVQSKGYFWAKLLRILREIGDHEVAQAVEAFSKIVEGYKGTVAYTKGSGAALRAYYYVTPVDETAPTPVDKASAAELDAMGAISDSTPIILTYQGEPILQRPLESAYLHAAYTNRLLLPPDVDLVTGKPCCPIRLHDRVGAIDAPLLSFDSEAYTFENQLRGANFPVAPETQADYSAGLQWVQEQKHTLMLVENVSKLQISWWVEGALEHPLLALLQPLLKGAKRPVLDQAWADLEATHTDDQLIRFMAWRGSKSRFALIETWVVKATDLRLALLQHHQEWGFTYDPVKAILTTSSIKGCLPIPYEVLVSAFKSITAGTPYPDSIYDYYIKVSQHRTYQNWAKAALERKFPNMKVLNEAARKYTINDSQPTLSQFTKHYLGTLKGAQRGAYQYGMLLAITAKIKEIYHYGKYRKSINTGDMLNVWKVPARFFSVGLAQHEVYRGWMRANMRTDQFVILDTVCQDLIAELADVPSRMHSINMQYVTIGYSQTQSYLLELQSFISQRHAAKSEEKKVPEITAPEL